VRTLAEGDVTWILAVGSKHSDSRSLWVSARHGWVVEMNVFAGS